MHSTTLLRPLFTNFLFRHFWIESVYGRVGKTIGIHRYDPEIESHVCEKVRRDTTGLVAVQILHQ